LDDSVLSEIFTVNSTPAALRVTPQHEIKQRSGLFWLTDKILAPYQWLVETVVPGTSQNAVLTIYALSASTGVVPVFYIFYAIGPFAGFLLLFVITFITGVISWMLCQAADHFNAHTCEEIALKSYGPNLATYTSVMMIGA
jgi:hypothetical protein